MMIDKIITDINPCPYYQVKPTSFSRTCQLLTTVIFRKGDANSIYTKSEHYAVSEVVDYDLKVSVLHWS